MHGVNDFKKGLKILVDGEPYTIVDFQHHKPGKGNAITRVKLRNLVSGSNLEKTFKSNEKFGVPDVEYVDVDFLYQDDTGYNFMNQKNYDQLALSDEVVGDAKNYLKENMTCSVCLYNERAVGIEIPNSVVLAVTETDPGHKGNTVTGATKPATLETGLKVNVPLHISVGDELKVDTRTGEYLERVNKG